MNNPISIRPKGKNQQGFVLVTAVMFLVVLTIVILSLMRTAILEERMIGNSRDWNNAFQAAEAALRDAELEIKSGTRISGQTGFVAGCSNEGLCLPNTCLTLSNCTPVWASLSATDTGWKTGSGSTKSVAYGQFTVAGWSLGQTGLRGVAVQPRYIVEALTVPTGSLKPAPGGSAAKNLYRVTAVGFGMNASSRVMLQSVVRPN